MNYLINPWWPTCEIHLLAGASGAGKTTLMFQLLEKWRLGQPVFGDPSYPCPFAYVRLDRSGQLTHESIKTAGADPSAYTCVDGRGVHKLPAEQRVPRLLEVVGNAAPDASFIIIEAFGLMAPGGKSSGYNETAAWLVECQYMLEQNDRTILGTVHVPKQREGSAITDPRQQASGSVAWAAFSATVMWLRRLNAMTPDDTRRQLYLLPRAGGGRERLIDMAMDDHGRLIECDEIDIKGDFFDVRLAQWPHDAPLPTATVTQWAEDVKATPRTAERWITRRLREPSVVGGDMLERVSRGTYRRMRKA